MDDTEIKLVNQILENLKKGMPETEILKILKHNKIDEHIAHKLLEIARKKYKDELFYEQVSPLLIVISSLAIMISVYLLKIFSINIQNLSGAIAWLNALWPLMFPLIGNVIIYAKYKHFIVKSLIITFSVILSLIVLLIILTELGY